MASAKDIAVLERKLKEAKSNREKIVLAKELKDLKSKLSTTQKQDTLPTQRRKIRMLSSAEFNELIARLKQKPEYSFLKSMGKKKIQDDYRVVGKPVGWRIKGKDNYKVPSKRFRAENPDLVYYENRINRSDVRRPNRLEQGGMMAKGGKTWKVSDTSKAKYVGIIEFQDNDGEYHNFEVMDNGDRLVFGGMTNSGFIESGYIEKDGFSTDEALQELYADLETYYNDGAEYTSMIVVNQRMATGGSLKKKDVKHPKAFKIDLDVESRMGNNEHFEVGKMRGYGDALVSRSALQHNAPDNYKYSVKATNKYAKGGKMKQSDLVEYVVPNWSVPCLINADFSGLNDEDEKSLDSFIEQVKNECGNAMFMLGDKSDDYGFSHRNDVDSYAGDVTTLYIMPNSSYAKGGKLKYYDKETEYRLGRPSGSIEKQILEKVKYYTSSDKLFVGNFGWVTPSKKRAEGYLYKVDGFETILKDVKLKEGEKIFIYLNQTTAIGGMTPLIKINLDKELLYFLADSENDEIVFETKGVPALYINLIQHKMARGGGVKKKDKTEPAPTPNADVNPMDSYNVELIESQGKDDKGTYYMFPKPADKNSKGVLFKKGGNLFKSNYSIGGL